jgi:hypothetical protein
MAKEAVLGTVMTCSAAWAFVLPGSVWLDTPANNPAELGPAAARQAALHNLFVFLTCLFCQTAVQCRNHTTWL